MQDDLQAFRLSEMQACLDEGQFPCRWTPQSGYGYGYPLFQYYAPGPFYVGSFFRLLGFQYIDIVKILFTVSTFVGGISMFLLLSKLANKSIAILSSVIYIYLPYHAQQLYVRGSLNEYFAGMLYPLVAYLGLNYFTKNTKRSLAFFSLALAFLFITHNLMSYFLIPILFIYSIYYKKFTKFLISLFLSLLLSSFFVIPLYAERQYVHLESLLGGYFGYEQHFVSIKQLLFDNRWGYGSSQLGTQENLSLSVGIVLLLATLVSILFSLVKPKNLLLTGLIGLYGVIVLFLIHEKSSIIWKIITPLEWLQFPWRLLLVVGFAFSILLFNLLNIFSLRIRKILIVSFVTLSLILHGNFFNPINWDYSLTDAKKFSVPNLYLEQTRSIFDYLPIFAKLPPNKPAPSTPEILDGTGNIVYWNKSASKQYGQIILSSGGTVRLPIYDFPGMKVKVNNSVVPHINNDCRNQDYCFGLISIKLDSGSHDISVELTRTLPRIIGDILSITALLIILILICVG